MTEKRETKTTEFFIQWPDVLIRAGLLTLLWWLLNGDDWLSWWLGVPAVILATAVSLIVVPPISWRIAPLPLIRFAGYFFLKSFLSSVDVASRVFRPRIPLQPAMIIYDVRLSGDFPPVLMANVTSLLPGTLSAELELKPDRRGHKRKYLKVHTLDERDPVVAELSRLEKHIAAVYRINLEKTQS